MVLVCYDGSVDARAAVEQAARLFGDEPATVLTVWEPFIEIAARSTVGFGLVPSVPDADEIDEASRTKAEETAAEVVKSLLLGSVSHEVIQHADRTVVVVPSPDMAASRARGLRPEEDSAPPKKAASNA